MSRSVDVRAPVVAFDLDMTLVDSAAGIVATQRQAAADVGVALDPADLRAEVGVPLQLVYRKRLPPHLVDPAIARYRELYPTLGVPGTTRLPGAAAALAAVRAQGGRTLVVSAKIEPAVHAVLRHVSLEVDAVAGDVFAVGKGAALREHAAVIMVGDHPGDMAGARAGGAVAVGVTTGPHDAAALRTAGAEAILDDLHAFPGWLESWLLPRRLAALDEELRRLGSVLVAFSGGADSSFVLAAAARSLGTGSVVAATAVSPSLPRAEAEAARATAEQIGVRHLEVPTFEGARPGYRANGADRCAFCKGELLDVLSPLAGSLGLSAVVTGTNADDARAGFRPGIRAAEERGARAPLRDAGLTKAQVRAASRTWGLPTWEKPAAACLASRIAYGVEVTQARLARVERAETELRALLPGVRDLRVRDLGAGHARIDVDADLVARVGPEHRRAVLAAGFETVEVDPRGFRSGSLNDMLPTAGAGVDRLIR